MPLSYLVAAVLCQTPQSSTITPRLADAGLSSAIRSYRMTLDTTQAAWDTTWKLHRNNRATVSATPPAVNFQKEVVLSIFVGETRGVLGVDFPKVIVDGNVIRISAKHRGFFDDGKKTPPLGTPFGYCILPRTKAKYVVDITEYNGYQYEKPRRLGVYDLTATAKPKPPTAPPPPVVKP